MLLYVYKKSVRLSEFDSLSSPKSIKNLVDLSPDFGQKAAVLSDEGHSLHGAFS